MLIEKLDEPIRPGPHSRVRYKLAGHISEIFWSTHKSRGGCIKRFDKDHFVDMRTGELREFQHFENRAQSLSSVARSLAQGRDMLNANVTDVRNCRWVTLTYRENMQNSKKLFYDFKNFNKRLRALYGHYEYVTAAEPQARGAWHLHVVMIFPGPAPYIPNDVMANAWKQGFVTVKRLDDVDNVGAYLTAYLGDLDLLEATTWQKRHARGLKEVEVEIDGKMVTKRYIKGGRLHLYPPGMHIFRWSKGVKKPTVEYIEAGQVSDKVSGQLTFEKTVSLLDEVTGFKSILNYRYYNTKRLDTKQDKSID